MNLPSNSTAPTTQGWRTVYKVHPAADVFPMMSEEELKALGEDIRANGLKHPIIVWHPPTRRDLAELIDGRNRLEAMERVGVEFNSHVVYFHCGDPVSWVKTLNLHRRHMLKSERADAIVALAKMSADKPDHGDPVSKGGRGKKSEVKAKALEINSALPKDQQVSEPTIKRSLAKAEGKPPTPSRSAAPPSMGPSTLEGWRRGYLHVCKIGCPNLDAELETIRAAFKEIVGKRALR